MRLRSALCTRRPRIPALPSYPLPPAEYYADLRNSQDVKALPVTVRTLETIIRLSCAHAKVGQWGGRRLRPCRGEGLVPPRACWADSSGPGCQAIVVAACLAALEARRGVG